MNKSICASTEGSEITIAASREDFAFLASVCSRLASLSDAELETPANHFHLMPGMENTSPDSQPLVFQAIRGASPTTNARRKV
jgi:hypothetical protein